MLLTKLKVAAAILLLCLTCFAACVSYLTLATVKADEKQTTGAKEGPSKPRDPPLFRNKIVLFGCQRTAQIGSGELDILQIELDGTGLKSVLAVKDAAMMHGRVSPDGRRLAYGVKRKSGAWETWVLEADGQQRQLPAGGEVMGWSPDGKSLACRVMNKDRTFENWIVDIESGKKRVLDLSKFDGVEDWSPTTAELVVSDANRDNVFKHPTKGVYPLRQLYRVGLDASKPRPIATGPMLDNLYSRVSPDGSLIAHYQRRHSADRTKVYESIVVHKRDGSEPVEVIGNNRLDHRFQKVKEEAFTYPFPWSPELPCWSPDGKQIVARVDNAKSGSGRVGDTRWALIFASLDGKINNAIDLTKLDLVFVANFDWR